MTLQVESGGTFDADLLSPAGSPISSGGGGGYGGIPGGSVPDPGAPPPPTKPSWLGSDSDEADDTDTPFLMGPELAIPLKGDVTEWSLFRWLPEHSGLNLYGHILVGELEIFEDTLDIELYGVGLGLTAPLLTANPFLVSATTGLGVGFLRTDIGDTAGLEASIGLQGVLFFTKNLSLVVGVEYMGFFASEVTASGPAANLGLNLSW